VCFSVHEETIVRRHTFTKCHSLDDATWGYPWAVSSFEQGLAILFVYVVNRAVEHCDDCACGALQRRAWMC